ncbi:MAG: hypothetical protein WBB23_21945 [Desulforhopalus sp.]
MNQNNTNTNNFDALQTLHSVELKMALIVQAVTPRPRHKIGDNALYGIITLLDEMQNDVCDVIDYCQNVIGIEE